MATLVFFHAHPDDEAIATGGTIARMADEGHRAILVFATKGEVGEVPEGFLEEDTELGDIREAEARKAAEILEAEEVFWLGYRDSGMETEVKEKPNSPDFSHANAKEASQKLTEILDRVSADVLTIYDPIGGYGHPDHIQVHIVGTQAASLAKKTPDLYWATMNREHFMRLREENEELREAMDGVEQDLNQDEAEDVASLQYQMKNPEGSDVQLPSSKDEDKQDEPENNFGWPEAEITHFIDVTKYMEQKIASLKAHTSQIPEDSFFLKLTGESQIAAFGTEWYVKQGANAHQSSSQKLTSFFD